MTEPLLIIEKLLGMKLDEATFNSKAWVLSVSSAMMIVSGYYGDQVVTSDLGPRFMCRFALIAFFSCR